MSERISKYGLDFKIVEPGVPYEEEEDSSLPTALPGYIMAMLTGLMDHISPFSIFSPGKLPSPGNGTRLWLSVSPGHCN